MVLHNSLTMGSACWEDYLKEVTEWVAKHPFDVVTILFGNSNWADTDANGKPLELPYY